jgi:hypothetical protein
MFPNLGREDFNNLFARFAFSELPKAVILY